MLRRVCLCSMVLVVVACSGPEKGPSELDAYTVQVADVSTSPKTIGCLGGGSRAIGLNIRMVNTTTDEVRVTQILSSGIVIRAPSSATLGKAVWVYDDVDFTPDDAVLRAHDGEVLYHALMVADCVAGGPGVDVSLSLFVRTNVGEFRSKPITIHQGISNQAIR